MTTNWSLVLNVILLIGVVVVLVRSVRGKKEVILPIDPKSKPLISAEAPSQDDIIAIRKVDVEDMATTQPYNKPESEETLMLFLLAKNNRQLAGYEMLQSILAAGLRFGEGQIFHRYQFTNSQGPVICSLAAATPEGTFDLQNIGAFQAKGLCLFMHLSGQASLDNERFEKMLEIAHQLAEGLDAHLLDNERSLFTEASESRYQQLIESTATREIA